MHWEKLGLVYNVDGSRDWMQSHAMLPTPILVGDDRIRVYFCSRDRQGISRITYVDVSRADPRRVLKVNRDPLLEIGRPGTFDDSGTLCTSAVQVGKDIYLYYTGYSRRVSVPYSNAVGLAVSSDGGDSFRRMFEGPVVDRTAWEPYFAIAANVCRDGDTWHMWYSSGTGWIEVDGKPESTYHIKYASSSDGIRWRRDNVTCVAPRHAQEAIARAAVLRQGGTWRMWYSFRGSADFRGGKDSYKIGYAEADNPLQWRRDDARAGISPAPGSWDSDMLAYPAVITVGGDTYLFYNGNGFGSSGFGVAIQRP